LILALVGSELLASRPDRFISGERAPGTLWIGDLMGQNFETGEYYFALNLLNLLNYYALDWIHLT
jgi:hypothetical protein